MKTLKGLFSLPTLLFLTLILSGCMPDSLTKFKEDPPVKPKEQGGTGPIPDADENCVVGNNNGGSCTPVTSLAYNGTGLTSLAGPAGSCSEVYSYIGEASSETLGSSVTFNPVLSPNNVSNLNDFIIYSMSKVSGSDLPLTLDATGGTLTFKLNGFAKSGTYRITATHAYTGSVHCAQITLNSVNKTKTLNPVLLADEYVVLSASSSVLDVDGEVLFPVGSGNSPNISTDKGANGVVEYVDRINNKITVRIPLEQGSTVFKIGDGLDASGSFSTARTSISRVVYSFDRTDFPSAWPINLYNDRNELIQSDEIRMQNIVISPEIRKVRSGVPSSGNYCINGGTDRRVLYQQNISNYIYLDACDLKIKMQGTVTDEVSPTSNFNLSVTNPKGTTITTSFRFSALSERPIKAVAETYYPQNWKGGNERYVLKVTSAAPFVKPTKLTGTLTLTSGSNIITGSGSSFRTQLIAGSLFVVRGKVYEVATTPVSNTSVTVVSAPTESVAGVEATPINWVITGRFNNNTDTGSDDTYSRALIESVDTGANEVYITRKSGYFKSGMSLYSGAEYISSQAEVSGISFVFSPQENLAVGITPLRCGVPLVDNGSGTALVCPTEGDLSGQSHNVTSTPLISTGSNLTLASATGTISEITAVDDLPVTPETVYTINTKTLLSDTYTSTFSYRVLETPSRLNYGNLVLLQLTDISSWVEGSFISGPASVPLSSTEAPQGIVRKVVGTDRLLVEVMQGQFEIEKGVDNIRFYASQKAEIIRADVVTARFGMNTNNNGNASTDDYITASSGARGVVVYVNGTDLYVRISSGRATTSNTITNNTTSGSLGTITEIESNQIRVTTSAAPTGDLQYIGALVINNAQSSRAVVNAREGTTTLNLQVATNYFSVGQSLDADRFYLAAEATISSISTDPRINLYRNSSSSVQMGIDVKESALKYEIIPTLPTGMTLDTDTGIISGTPTDSLGDKSYVVIARNEAGSTYHEFTLRVHNQFEIVDKSELPSYYLHQEGPADANHLCRVTEDNILASQNSGNETFRDLNCRLEVAELDLYNKGMKLEMNISAGVCQHYSFTPYSFWQFAPVFSIGSIRQFAGSYADSSCSELRLALTGDPEASSTPDGEAIKQCLGIYKDGSKEVNCDEGEVEVSNYNFSTSNGICQSDPEITTEDSCGSCSDPTHTTNTACTGAAETWTTAWRTGFCISTDASRQSAATCSGAGFSWDSDRNVCIITADNNNSGNCVANGHSWTMCSYAIETLPNFECGGNVYNCREGAIRDIFDSDSISKGIGTQTGSSVMGGKIPFEFDALVGPDYGSTMKLANFTMNNSCMHRNNTATDPYVPSGDNRNNFKYYSAQWEDYSGYAITAYDAMDPFQQSEPFYTFNCLDSASDIIGRVRLQVREWDRTFTPASNINFLNPGIYQNSYELYNYGLGEYFNSSNDIDNFNEYSGSLLGCSSSAAPTPPIGASLGTATATNSNEINLTGHGRSVGDYIYVGGRVLRVARVKDANTIKVPYLVTVNAQAYPVIVPSTTGSVLGGTTDITVNRYDFSNSVGLVAGDVGDFIYFVGDDGYAESHRIRHVAGGMVYLETAPTQSCTTCTLVQIPTSVYRFPGASL